VANQLFSRQSDLIPARVMGQLKFCVIGCGGIGSNVVELLARMGAQSITVYDDDEVKEVNVAPGAFRIGEVGQYKASTLQAVAHKVTNDGVVKPITRRYMMQSGEYNIVIVTIDTLSGRRDIWERNSLDWEWWIDARMGRDIGCAYCVSGVLEHEW